LLHQKSGGKIFRLDFCLRQSDLLLKKLIPLVQTLKMEISKALNLLLYVTLTIAVRNAGSGIIFWLSYRRNMDEKTKSNLEELETLRELALFGEEDQREEAQKAYEKLRDELLCTEQ
jgi:hypothetical protein